MKIFSKLDGSKRQKIALKRAVGRDITEVDAPALSAFYSTVSVSPNLEPKAFYIACLYAEQGGNGNVTLAKAWRNEMKEDQDIRLLHLLDRPWNKQTAVELTRVARRLMRSYSIDFEDLFWDIYRWGKPETKRKWAIALTETEKENGGKDEKKD